MEPDCLGLGDLGGESDGKWPPWLVYASPWPPYFPSISSCLWRGSFAMISCVSLAPLWLFCAGSSSSARVCVSL